MPTPLDTALYKRVKQLANKKFKSPSGIYRSSWIVKEYKKRGGKYNGKKSNTKGLRRWFREDWRDLKTGKKCGRKSASKGSYPLCRPTKRITNSTPRTVSEISKKSINKAKRDKKNKKYIQFGKGPVIIDNNIQSELKFLSILSLVALFIRAVLF